MFFVKPERKAILPLVAATLAACGPTYAAAPDGNTVSGSIVYDDPSVGTFSIGDGQLPLQGGTSTVPAWVELGKDAPAVDPMTGESSEQFTSSGAVGVRAVSPAQRDNAFQISANVYGMYCGFDADLVVELPESPGTYDLQTEHARVCVKDFVPLEQVQFCEGRGPGNYVGPANVVTCLPIGGSLALTQSTEQCHGEWCIRHIEGSVTIAGGDSRFSGSMQFVYKEKLVEVHPPSPNNAAPNWGSGFGD